MGAISKRLQEDECYRRVARRTPMTRREEDEPDQLPARRRGKEPSNAPGFSCVIVQEARWHERQSETLTDGTPANDIEYQRRCPDLAEWSQKPHCFGRRLPCHEAQSPKSITRTRRTEFEFKVLRSWLAQTINLKTDLAANGLVVSRSKSLLHRRSNHRKPQKHCGYCQ